MSSIFSAVTYGQYGPIMLGILRSAPHTWSQMPSSSHWQTHRQQLVGATPKSACWFLQRAPVLSTKLMPYWMARLSSYGGERWSFWAAEAAARPIAHGITWAKPCPTPQAIADRIPLKCTCDCQACATTCTEVAHWLGLHQLRGCITNSATSE